MTVSQLLLDLTTTAGRIQISNEMTTVLAHTIRTNRRLVVMLILSALLLLLEEALTKCVKFVTEKLRRQTWSGASVMSGCSIIAGLTINKIAQLFLVFIWSVLSRLGLMVCAAGYGIKELVRIAVFGTENGAISHLGNACTGFLLFLLLVVWWKGRRQDYNHQTNGRIISSTSGTSCSGVNSSSNNTSTVPNNICSRIPIRNASTDSFVTEEEEEVVNTSDEAREDTALADCITCNFLMAELDREIESNFCIVCQNEPKCVILLPCAHVCVCESCKQTLLDTSSNCPICRQEIEETFRVYV